MDFTHFILHKVVATQSRCGGMFSNHFTTNFSQNAAVKKFWESVNDWQRYGQNFVAYFLGHSIQVNISQSHIQNKGQGHSFWYQSISHTTSYRLSIVTFARGRTIYPQYIPYRQQTTDVRTHAFEQRLRRWSAGAESDVLSAMTSFMSSANLWYATLCELIGSSKGDVYAVKSLLWLCSKLPALVYVVVKMFL